MLDIGLAKDGVPSRGWQTWIICTVMVVIAGIFVTIRLIARHLRTGIQIDDWTTLAALVCSYKLFKPPLNPKSGNIPISFALPLTRILRSRQHCSRSFMTWVSPHYLSKCWILLPNILPANKNIYLQPQLWNMDLESMSGTFQMIAK